MLDFEENITNNNHRHTGYILINVRSKPQLLCTTLKTRGFRVFKYIYYEIRTKVI